MLPIPQRSLSAKTIVASSSSSSCHYPSIFGSNNSLIKLIDHSFKHVVAWVIYSVFILNCLFYLSTDRCIPMDHSCKKQRWQFIHTGCYCFWNKWVGSDIVNKWIIVLNLKRVSIFKLFQQYIITDLFVLYRVCFWLHQAV